MQGLNVTVHSILSNALFLYLNSLRKAEIISCPMFLGNLTASLIYCVNSNVLITTMAIIGGALLLFPGSLLYLINRQNGLCFFICGGHAGQRTCRMIMEIILQ